MVKLFKEPEGSVNIAETILAPSTGSVNIAETILAPSTGSVNIAETILAPSTGSVNIAETILAPSLRELSAKLTEGVIFHTAPMKTPSVTANAVPPPSGREAKGLFKEMGCSNF